MPCCSTGYQRLGQKSNILPPGLADPYHFRGVGGIILDVFDDFVAEDKIKGVVAKWQVFANALDYAGGCWQGAEQPALFLLLSQKR